MATLSDEIHWQKAAMLSIHCGLPSVAAKVQHRTASSGQGGHKVAKSNIHL
jgi:hypothetical protein